MSESADSSLTPQALKQMAAQAAIEYLLPKLSKDRVLGIGTGSTTNAFIDLLGNYKQHFAGAVASSEDSAERLRALGIDVFDLNNTGSLEFYIDGADAVTPHLAMTKGGGAALTREKIIAASAREFICMVDESKQVDLLGAFPIPVEVIPMGRSYVARQLVALGGQPEYREGVITDNGNVILDVSGWRIQDPEALEAEINQITGVVTSGLFAKRRADLLIVGTNEGVRRVPKPK